MNRNEDMAVPSTGEKKTIVTLRESTPRRIQTELGIAGRVRGRTREKKKRTSDPGEELNTKEHTPEMSSL